jgi:hypothetical protein
VGVPRGGGSFGKRAALIAGLRHDSWCTPVDRCARRTTATWLGNRVQGWPHPWRLIARGCGDVGAEGANASPMSPLPSSLPTARLCLAVRPVSLRQLAPLPAPRPHTALGVGGCVRVLEVMPQQAVTWPLVWACAAVLRCVAAHGGAEHPSMSHVTMASCDTGIITTRPVWSGSGLGVVRRDQVWWCLLGDPD